MSAWVVIRGGLADQQSEGVTVIDVDFMEDSFVDIDTLEEAWNKLNDIEEIPELESLAREAHEWIDRVSDNLEVKICPSCGMIRPRSDYPEWAYGKCEDCGISPV